MENYLYSCDNSFVPEIVLTGLGIREMAIALKKLKLRLTFM